MKKILLILLCLPLLFTTCKKEEDNTVEGIKHKKQNCIAVQFHPEAAPGPFDCKFVFEELKKLMEK